MKCRYFFVSLFCVVGVPLLVVVWLGTILSAPNPVEIGALPAGLSGNAVEFSSKTGQPLSGWLVPGDDAHGGVLLLHGVRSNRRQMIGRAKFLNQAGYTVLLFDFQAHGESPGDHITFGYLEAYDAEAALAYLQKHIKRPSIGVIGVSLGGAAALLGTITECTDALVLESVYPTLKEAVVNRITMRLGSYGRHLAPLLLWQVQPRLGFNPEVLTPIDRLSDRQVPILMIAGAEDRHTPLSESQKMFEVASEPKQLWVVQGAAHEDFHRYAPVRYQNRVLDFFRRYLDARCSSYFRTTP